VISDAGASFTYVLRHTDGMVSIRQGANKVCLSPSELRRLFDAGKAQSRARGDLGGLGQGASASVGQAASLGTLSVSPSWADAVSSVTPLPALDANVMPGGWARCRR
jgi:hypothetical protein